MNKFNSFKRMQCFNAENSKEIKKNGKKNAWTFRNICNIIKDFEKLWMVA